MKLYMTATSERGKEVTKSGNEYLCIDIKNAERKTIACITLYEGKKELRIDYERNYIKDIKRIPWDNIKVNVNA